MRVELKCQWCNQKYYSPHQDQLHTSCRINSLGRSEQAQGEGKIIEHGGVDEASPSHINPEVQIKKLPSGVEVMVDTVASHIEIPEQSKPSEKKIKKIPEKKVDKRSREYRQSIGR